MRLAYNPRTNVVRATLSAMRKDGAAERYGGDVSRKKKRLEKHKTGKKRLCQFGKFNIRQEVLVSALDMGGSV